MRPADAAVAAEALRRILRAVERGELYASAIERHAIAGAVLALDAIAETSTGADQNEVALETTAERPTEAD
jgi:anti-anti-sigma factor